MTFFKDVPLVNTGVILYCVSINIITQTGNFVKHLFVNPSESIPLSSVYFLSSSRFTASVLGRQLDLHAAMEAILAYHYDRALRRERRYRDPLDPMSISDDNLLRYYRFPRHEIIRLCEELDPLLGRKMRRSHAVPTHTQVLVALRFYASGTFQNVLGDSVGLTQASISRIIGDVTQILSEKARN